MSKKNRIDEINNEIEQIEAIEADTNTDAPLVEPESIVFVNVGIITSLPLYHFFQGI